jgi:transcriptional regulator with GAF, ATPase, and Fis domain
MNNANNSACLPDDIAEESGPGNLSQLSVTSVANNNCVQLLDIFEAIFNKLSQLYSIDCAGLMLYNNELTKLRVAYIIESAETRNHVNLKVIRDETDLNVIAKEIAAFQFPMLKTRLEWEKEFNINHCLMNDNSEYDFHCYIPLENNNQILGTLELHNIKKGLSADGLNFCSSIADLLADIVTRLQITSTSDTGNDDLILANILANQKIQDQLIEINNYKQQLEVEKLYLTEEIKINNNYPDIIGQGPAMKQLFSLLTQISNSDSTVLILGDTGAGKELIARAIHTDSDRRENLMIKVNCAAIPPSLIESELFGHEKGSFTGATERRLGKFELANNSTLFLDEIGELSLELQVKLLRVLQEKEFERVGGAATIKTNVRLISATNRDLLEEVEAGRFRRDLFYRLNVFPIKMPPLRKRKEDIPLLAMHFLNRFVKKAGKNIMGFSQKALNDLVNYQWPGNVRELEHLVERQVLLAKGNLIKEIKMPTADKTIVNDNDKLVKVKTIDENERDHIFAVLKSCNGKVSGAYGAAKLLGVPATTLNSKIKRLGLTKKHLY